MPVQRSDGVRQRATSFSPNRAMSPRRQQRGNTMSVLRPG